MLPIVKSNEDIGTSSCNYIDCNATDSLTKWIYRVKIFGRVCYGTHCTISNGASLSYGEMVYAFTSNKI
jgi:hypothetical protein